MKQKIENIFYRLTGIFTSTISFPIFLYGFHVQWLLAIVSSITIGFILYKGLKWRSQKRFLKQHKMTKDEFTYIHAQLKKANEEIRNLQNAFLKVRSIENFKLAKEITKNAHLIQRTIVANPKSFFQAENFYYIHLPAASELLGEFLSLSKHSINSFDQLDQMKRTKKTLYEISNQIESEWNNLLFNRTDHLHTQVFLTNAHLKRRTNPPLTRMKAEQEIDG